ncbi:MAG: phosphate ABC transporter substrate-binding protein PstS family protein [Rhodospirillaceae bacterium]|nr:phosphate ABC transporter substrate-binding protein PstS family protein [Rhodospirillaceae bacterium]
MLRTVTGALFVGALLATSALVTQAGAVDVDPALKDYKKVSGVEGNLKSIGSDTLNNLMTLWAEGFSKEYPNVKIEIEGKGSSTAPPALISGTAQFGPMSRPMRAGELDDFEKKYGYKPTVLRTAVDALAVFVHKDNPAKCLSLQQVDAIFSKSRKRGLKEDITTWGQVGVTGEWADKPISLYGRNSASGTYGYFKEVALGDGDYKDTVKEQPGSSAVVQGVASDKFAIGYSGVGYKTADVKALPLSAKNGDSCHEASPEEAYAGNYPITRFLYVYLNKNPGRNMDPLRSEFVKYVLSKQGQMVVLKDGYYPLPAAVADQDAVALGLK